MILQIHPLNPQERLMQQAIKMLATGAVAVIPTDTVYAFACDSSNSQAVERVCKLKGISLEKANFSFLFSDLSHISDFTRQFDTTTYKLLKKALPGPYTFILNANNNIPSRYFGKRTHKKTIGIRIPDCEITRQLIKELDRPLICTSVHDDDKIIDYTTDPELIHEQFEHTVDFVIDAGSGGNQPSTIIDCTGDVPEVVREGKGSVEIL